MSRGRLHAEPEDPSRTVYERDRDRIIHTAAFRRLQYKTQVFVYHEGENYRTRLTHSLEVSQIARSIGRVLGLNGDLAEALSLAHDLGHTCFGHAGEDALQACMKDFGGFDHNAQSLRIVTSLEHRYAAFDGLNLSWETLEGLVKHNGPLVGRLDSLPLPQAIADYNARHDLALDRFPAAEAQVAALSDDIAYNNHDLDDGLRAGLFTLADVLDVPLAGPVFFQVRKDYPEIDQARLFHEANRRLISQMIKDVCAETKRRLEAARPRTADEVRALGEAVVAFSDEMRDKERALKAFLFTNMYRHYRVNRMTSKARRVVKELFDLFLGEPRLLPDEWRARCGDPGGGETARLVADYIAGMTDRFALEEHQRLFDPTVRP